MLVIMCMLKRCKVKYKGVFGSVSCGHCQTLLICYACTLLIKKQLILPQSHVASSFSGLGRELREGLSFFQKKMIYLQQIKSSHCKKAHAIMFPSVSVTTTLVPFLLLFASYAGRCLSRLQPTCFTPSLCCHGIVKSLVARQ